MSGKSCLANCECRLLLRLYLWNWQTWGQTSFNEFTHSTFFFCRAFECNPIIPFTQEIFCLLYKLLVNYQTSLPPPQTFGFSNSTLLGKKTVWHGAKSSTGCRNKRMSSFIQDEKNARGLKIGVRVVKRAAVKSPSGHFWLRSEMSGAWFKVVPASNPKLTSAWKWLWSVKTELADIKARGSAGSGLGLNPGDQKWQEQVRHQGIKSLGTIHSGWNKKISLGIKHCVEENVKRWWSRTAVPFVSRKRLQNPEADLRDTAWLEEQNLELKKAFEHHNAHLLFNKYPG